MTSPAPDGTVRSVDGTSSTAAQLGPRRWLIGGLLIGLAVALVVWAIAANSSSDGPSLTERLDTLQASVDSLGQQVQNLQAQQSATTTSRFDLPVPNHDAEVLRVNDVVTRFFALPEEWQPLVDDPADLDADIAALRESGCTRGATMQLSSLAFAAEDRAQVDFTVESDALAAPGYPLNVEVVRRDGGWKVSAASIRAIAGLARSAAGSTCGGSGDAPTTTPS